MCIYKNLHWCVIHEDMAYVSKLPNYASIFTAELTVVATDLDLVFSSSDSRFGIYSDSRSTLEIIKKFNNFDLFKKCKSDIFGSPISASLFISVESPLMWGYTVTR